VADYNRDGEITIIDATSFVIFFNGSYSAKNHQIYGFEIMKMKLYQ
jgi:hypothetical protein